MGECMNSNVSVALGAGTVCQDVTAANNGDGWREVRSAGRGGCGQRKKAAQRTQELPRRKGMSRCACVPCVGRRVWLVLYDRHTRAAGWQGVSKGHGQDELGSRVKFQ